jgi:excisionase family DNA binding protein
MTVRQAAEKLEVSAATVYSLVASGKLRCHRIGMGRGVIRIAEEHLADYLRGAEPVPSPAPSPSPKPRLRHLRSR